MNNGEDRWQTFRDVLLFQGKLLVDGLRDLLLSPVSIGAALIDLIVPGDDKGRRFYSVVRFGRRTEQWINLFGAADRHDPEKQMTGVDAIADELEAMIRDPHKRSEAQAKAREILSRLKRPDDPA
ncbi:MAG: hypothetical protein R3270_04000 [Gammaproteobacteria bacterium]|nr:hypothetical protein [Gammaproteobacteria bacterium]